MLTCLFSRLTAAVLLLFSTVCLVEPHHLPENGPIPDADIAADMQAVDAAIQTPWVERNPSGVQRLETKRQSFSLTDAQKALFDRHWELETISREKPTAPKQVDMELLADALDVVVEMHEPERAVWLRMDKLEAWASGVANGGFGQQQVEAEKRTDVTDGAKEGGGKPVQLTNLIGEDEKQTDEEGDAAANEQCDEKDRPKVVAAVNATFPVPAENVMKQVEAQNPAVENTQTEQDAPLNITGTVQDGPKVVMIVVGDGNTTRRAFTQDEASEEAKPVVKVETVSESDEDEDKVEEVKNDMEKEENVENAVETVKAENQPTKSEEDEKAVFQAIQAVNEQKQRQIQHAVPGVLVVDLEKPEEEESAEEEKVENAGNTGMPEVEVVQLQEDAPNGSDEVVESPKEEVVQQNVEQGNAFLRGLGVLSRLLLGRAKRSADEEIVLPVGNGTAPITMTKEEGTQTEEDPEKKPKTLKMMRSFMGRMQMGNRTLGISATYEMTMNAPKKEDGDKKEEAEDEVEGESKEEPIKVEKTEENAVEDNKKPLLSFLIPFRVLAPAAEPENVVEPEEQLIPEENAEKENEAAKVVEIKPEPIEKVPAKNPSEIPEEKALSDKEKIAAISAVQSQMDSPKIHEEKAPIPEQQAKQEILNYLASGIAKTAGPKKDEKLAYIWYSELQYWLAKRIEHDFAKSGMTSVVDVLGLPAGGEDLDYLRAQWAKTEARLAKLVDWIGKEFRRRK